jgi:hypothetical protein
MQDRPDIIATVRFLTTEAGGRKGPTPASVFRCMLRFEGHLFDSVLLLHEVGALAPGTTAKVPVRFLFPELIKSRLAPGDRFHLWESREIAEGIVDEVIGE